MAVITNTIRWADNTAQLKANIAEGIGTIDAMKKSVDKTAAALGGEGLFRAANQTTAAIMQMGGANKLTAGEQERVNTQLEKAIEKYRLMGKDPPAAMVALAAATKQVDDATAHAGHTAMSLADQYVQIFSGDATKGMHGLSTGILEDATAVTEAVGRIGGAAKLTDAEQAKVNKTVTEAIEKYRLMGKEPPAAMVALAKATQQAKEPTVALSAAVGVLAAQLVSKAATALTSMGREALMTSARVETLGGVARFMGAQAGFTGGEINALTAALVRQGITTAQASDTVIQMVRANLSLADATRLATVAQSLARATGENSSVTLGKLIQGTQTLQVEVLRNAGVVIQLDQEYKKFAETNNRTVESLSAQEKQQIALAAVLREGEKVAGVYGVTNEFVGGKIQSMARHQEEAARAVGDVFQPALRIGVDALTWFLKVVQSAPSTFAALGVGIVGASTALIGLKSAAALGVISTGALTTAMAALWPAVAIVATGFAAWKFGTWIGETLRLTDAVEWLAARIMGVASADINATIAARNYANSAAGKTAAITRQATELATLEEKARADEKASLAQAKADALMAEAKEKATKATEKFREKVTELGTELSGNVSKEMAILNAAVALLPKGWEQNIVVAERVRLAYEKLKIESGLLIDGVSNITPWTMMGMAVDATGKSVQTFLEVMGDVPKVTGAAGVALLEASAHVNAWTTSTFNAKTGQSEFMKEMAQAPKVTGAARETVIELSDALANLTNALHQLATISGTTFGGIVQWLGTVLGAMNLAVKAVEAFGKGIDTFKAGDKIAGFGQIAAGIMGMATAFMQATASGNTFQKTLSGLAVGAQIGSMFGPWGTAIGAAVGALGGFLRGLFGVKQAVLDVRKEVETFEQRLAASLTQTQLNEAAMSGWGETGAKTAIAVRDAFLAVRRTAEEAEQAVLALWDTDHPERARAAMEEINRVLLQQKQLLEQNLEVMEEIPPKQQKLTWQEMEALANKYGISLKALGPAFAQAKLFDQAQDIVEAFTQLVNSGAKSKAVLRGMADEVQKLVTQALKTGQALPESMRPMLEQMLKMGLLTDENGKKLTNLDKLKFTKGPESEFAILTKSINALIVTLGGVPPAVNDIAKAIVAVPDVDIKVAVDDRQWIDWTKDFKQFDPKSRFRPTPAVSFATGSGGIRDFGAGTPAMLHGREAVVTEREIREGGPVTGSPNLDAAVARLERMMDRRFRSQQRGMEKALFLAARDGALQRRGRR